MPVADGPVSAVVHAGTAWYLGGSFSRLSQYRGDASLSTWLHTIATSVSLNGMRSVTRIRGRSTNIDDLPELPAAPHRASPHDLRERLHASIDALSQKLRPVFVMHDVEGYTHEEIAESLGITSGGSKSQLFKARAKLRRLLSHLVDGSGGHGTPTDGLAPPRARTATPPGAHTIRHSFAPHAAPGY